MRTKTILLILFALLAFVQLYVPASMILSEEEVLSKGKELKFRIQPVDPADPFRGRYIILSFADDKAPRTALFENKDKAFALFTEDSAGFTIIKKLADKAPSRTDTYLEVEIAWQEDDGIRIRYPFTRFYMEESLAPEAESLVRARETELSAYALVSIYKGKGIVKDVYVAGMPIREYIKKQREEQK